MAYNYDRRKVAAESIPFEALPEPQKAVLRFVPSRWVIKDVWEGIHGYVVDFAGHPQLTKNILDKLTSFKPFRWIETRGGSQKAHISVGI